MSAGDIGDIDYLALDIWNNFQRLDPLKRASDKDTLPIARQTFTQLELNVTNKWIALERAYRHQFWATYMQIQILMIFVFIWSFFLRHMYDVRIDWKPFKRVPPLAYRSGGDIQEVAEDRYNYWINLGIMGSTDIEIRKGTKFGGLKGQSIC
ncbi:hypothetical protein B0J17DRAFT_625606 [Rhizoctonia solani]|nr:hypothetical protein B0J17DRAFT_625606 [Rhizoctonia solani]